MLDVAVIQEPAAAEAVPGPDTGPDPRRPGRARLGADGVSALLDFAGTALMFHHLCGPDPDGAEAARQQRSAGLPPGRAGKTPHHGAVASNVVDAAASHRKPDTRNP
ncbi:hypothetical protein [Streptomyces olivochromogenes]|uniref:hypothetical protein n=1 Tax=Streptomyces olivochromogenes TaxID=1963 RepID=UPI001911BDC2|nr:hypothetical protein [Streptomyces olivochromogenes]